MIYATLSLERDKTLFTLLKSEETTFRHTRSSYTVTEERGRLVAKVEAQDATALKATIASICRVAAVHEKAKGFR